MAMVFEPQQGQGNQIFDPYGAGVSTARGFTPNTNNPNGYHPTGAGMVNPSWGYQGQFAGQRVLPQYQGWNWLTGGQPSQPSGGPAQPWGGQGYQGAMSWLRGQAGGRR